MRIAMIGSRGMGTNYGGIERVLDGLCPELVRLGHEVDVFSTPEAVDANHPGIRAIGVPAFGGKHFDNLSRSVRAMLQAVGHYDLIHFHAVGPGILSVATRLMQQASVVTIHGLDQRRAKWGPAASFCLSMAERTLVKHSDAVTVVSDNLRRYFVERYDLRTSFIPNGVSESVRIPPGSVLDSMGLVPQRYFLFASRLTPEKGCHDLIEAFNQIDTDMRLVIAGTAPSADYVASLKALADPAKICFAGHRSGDALGELFSNAFAFVLPSYIEGMSMALLEALSYGIPPLVSDIPENRAVAGQHGFYFPPHDVVALRHLIGDLLAHPGAVTDLATQLETVRQPDWAAVAGRYDRLYAEALRNRVKQPLGVAEPARV